MMLKDESDVECPEYTTCCIVNELTDLCCPLPSNVGKFSQVLLKSGYNIFSYTGVSEIVSRY